MVAVRQPRSASSKCECLVGSSTSFLPSQAGLLHQVTQIADASELPLRQKNRPGPQGGDVSVETTVRSRASC